MTLEAIYKHIQEVSKMYGHLNYLRANTEGGASIAIGGFAPTPDDLPASGVPVNTVYLTNGDTYELYVWDGQNWNHLNLNALPVATTEQAGLVQLGTLAGVRSDIPSPTKAVTEELLANYQTGGGAGVPSGTIVQWWGNKQNVPAGWAFCDGSIGTPDLRGKYTKCVGDGKDVGGATGGSANTVLVEANLPVHRHGVSISVTSTGSQGTHTHTLSSSAHTHSLNLSTNNTGGHYHDISGTFYGGTGGGAAVISGGGTASVGWTSNAGSHAHSVTGNTGSASAGGNTAAGGGGTITVGGTVSGNTGNVGNATAFSNEPPFMELLYIMKL
jgi:microcystin-dependent protein